MPELNCKGISRFNQQIVGHEDDTFCAIPNTSSESCPQELLFIEKLESELEKHQQINDIYQKLPKEARNRRLLRIQYSSYHRTYHGLLRKRYQKC